MQTSTRRILAIAASFLFAAASLAHARPAASGGYTVQAGTFSERSNAERLAARLNGMNLEASCYHGENGLHAVTFGNFSTWRAALDTAQHLYLDHVISSYLSI